MALQKEALTREDKKILTEAVAKAGIMTGLTCQIVLHCAGGTVQAVEFQSLKLK